MSIRKEINIVIIISLVVFFSFSCLIAYFSLKALSEKEIKDMESLLMEERQNQLRDLIANAWSVLENADYYEQTQKSISEMRFGPDKKNYFFIVDKDGLFWVNPARPELVGKMGIDIRDADSKPYVKDIISKALVGNEGSVKYLEKIEGIEKPATKLTYYRFFKNWNWILCTGLYIDDIEKTIQAKRRELNASLGKQLGLMAFLGLATLVIVTVFMGTWASRRLIRPIQHLTQMADRMSRGDFAGKIEVRSNAEINRLAESIEKMQSSLSIAISRWKAKKDH